MIEISINRKNIKNLRIQKVFNPSILAVIKDYENPRIHNYHDEFIAFMNNNHLEINVSNNEDKIDTNPIT